MDASAKKSKTPEQTDGRGHSGKDPSVGDDVKSLWHELRELNHMQLQLAALEAQQAGKSLVIMMVAGVIAAVLLSVAWAHTTHRYFKFTACSGSLADNK